MRLLYTDGPAIRLTEFADAPTGDYAILSHTWALVEVTFQDMMSGSATDEQGFEKIRGCCEKASEEGIKYSWVDTCCIDKASSAELSEAINSMYRWYQEAKICYVYLSDVQSESEIAGSRWFTRGWTLQELIAPRNIIFLNREWKELGTKESLQGLLNKITRIPPGVLSGEEDLEDLSIAQRMSWAARRVTTRVEDRAYSLMGIFGINMPLIYGEGKRSFARLQEEILKVVDDQSIFAWRSDSENHGGLLAISPDAFRDSADIISFNPFSASAGPMTQSSKGIHLELRLIATDRPGQGLAILNCKDRARGNHPLAIYLEDLLMTMEQFERIE
ncbi:HET-domain-containing protein [Aspergillus sclerotiicarbonarius CBS 121057]|uniref:HET-domain-containing protein n=1 Tax=Aspergillus sclerotiicarbonarius (strain CBS 121057 / IBT 28362) TaxID=1448318 RepID=A0A319E6Y6_ASPSB|nr:HET-domain-containing protein [Aspergillus sclerotiicarbonarius CBS 121057]